MKFKCDENLPADLAASLRREGHDAFSVLDERLGGAADPTIAKVCQDEGRILMTLDLDFANIQTYPPQDYHGIVVLRLARPDRGAVWRSCPAYLLCCGRNRSRGDSGSWTRLGSASGAKLDGLTLVTVLPKLIFPCSSAACANSIR